MGEMALNFFMLIGLVDIVVSVIGLCLPLHKVSFFTLGMFKVFDMQTYVLNIVVGKDTNDFCFALKKLTCSWDKQKCEDEDFCKGLSGEHDIQDMAQRFCTPVMKMVFPNTCDALNHANVVGMALIACLAISIVLAVVVIYLLYDYQFRSPKARTRKIAVALLSVGFFFHIVGIAVYGGLVLLKLDDMAPRGSGLTKVALTPNDGIGPSIGYALLVLCAGVQVIMLIMTQFMKVSQELDEEECIAAKQDKLAAAQYGATAYEEQPASGGYDNNMGYGSGAAAYDTANYNDGGAGAYGFAGGAYGGTYGGDAAFAPGGGGMQPDPYGGLRTTPQASQRPVGFGANFGP